MWPTLSYLSVLLDHLIWPRTKEEIEVQYTTDGPICDGRVGGTICGDYRSVQNNVLYLYTMSNA